MPLAITHVLARAAADRHNDTETAQASQALGAALDAELDALDTVTTCASLRALVSRVGFAATHEYSSGVYYARVRQWEATAITRVHARALELFPTAADTAWIADIHPPYTP